MSPCSLIDQARYPIDDPGSDRARRLAAEAHDTFVSTGLCALPGFLSPAAASRLADEVMERREAMHLGRTIHNIYQHDDQDPAYDTDHPRNRQMVSECLCLPYDDIPRGAGIREIYGSDALTRFVSAVVNGHVDDPPALYRFADPLGALTINVLQDGHQIGWHFDQAQFVVVLLLQGPEAGGRYEVAPESRWSTEGIADFALHRRVLDQREPAVISHGFAPGTLFIHRGTHSLHRVTEVRGPRPRVSALLAYANEPGATLTPSVRQTYYGRQQARGVVIAPP